MTDTRKAPVSAGLHRLLLRREARNAEWNIPEGRIGQLVLQQRYRARSSLRRAAWLFALLCTVIVLGLLFYLGLPFLQQFADGKRDSLNATKTAIGSQTSVMDRERVELIGVAGKSGLLKNLEGALEPVTTVPNRDIEGHVKVNGGHLFFGSNGLILRTGPNGADPERLDVEKDIDFYRGTVFKGRVFLFGRDGEVATSLMDAKKFTVKRPFGSSEEDMRSLIQTDQALLIYGADGTVLRFNEVALVFEKAKTPRYGLVRSYVTTSETIVIAGSKRNIVSADNGRTFTSVEMTQEALTPAEKVLLDTSTDSRVVPPHVRIPARTKRLFSIDDKTLIFFTGVGRIYRSEDKGRSFDRVPQDDQYILRRVFALGNQVFLSGPSVLLRSLDSGKTFAVVEASKTLDEVADLVREVRKEAAKSPATALNSTTRSVLSRTNSVFRGPAFSGGFFGLSADEGSLMLFGDGNRVLRAAPPDGPLVESKIDHPGSYSRKIALKEGGLLLYGTRGDIVRTFDNGRTFTPLDTFSDMRRVSQTSWGDTLFVYDRGRFGSALSLRGTSARSGGFFKSVDNVQSFIQVPLPQGITIEGHAQTQDGVLFYGSEGTLFLASNALAIKATTLLTGPSAVSDQDVLDFIATDLPDYVREGAYASAARNRLLDIKARRDVLLELRNTTQKELDALSGPLRNTFLRQTSREEFSAFMNVCRGPVSGLQRPVSDDPDAPVVTYSAEPLTLACLEGWKVQRASEEQQWWQSVAQQVPPGVLLLFLLATLGGLYRYNMRMAGFHNSRADALELLTTKIKATDVATLEKLSLALAADKVEFGKASTPTDQAIELAKAVSAKG